MVAVHKGLGMGIGEVGLVIIGRNEGDRLRRCLQSAESYGALVYVDSGSTDGSQDLAQGSGFHVLQLGRDQEFTAARARNLGIFFIAENYPQVRYVQTVDGDCQIVSAWLPQALGELKRQADLAVIFGRRRERFPDRNIYHRACEVEWNVPAGPASSCGGDALFRLDALIKVNGFNPVLIAGEEPDLCFRLRQSEWGILSDGRDMTLHDVDITNCNQWWRRALRAGHAVSELVAIHGKISDKSWRRFLLSIFMWPPLLLLSCMLLIAWGITGERAFLFVSSGGVIIILVHVIRTAWRARSHFESVWTAIHWSSLLLISKLAQVQGALLYWYRRLTSSRKALIEYK